MTEAEFITKALKDRAFLLEVIKNVPDELLNEENQQSGQNFGGLLGNLYFEASKVMGYSFDEAAFKAECSRQFDALKGFAKAKCIGRFVKSLMKTGKGKKE